MDQQQISREMLKLNKSVMDNTFSTISNIHDQSAKMFTALMDKSAWLPDDGKKAITTWFSAYKKGCDDFKTAIDDKYEIFANHFIKKENTENTAMKK